MQLHLETILQYLDQELDWFREVTQRCMEAKFNGRLERRRPKAVMLLIRIADCDGGEWWLGVRGRPEARGDLDEGRGDR